MSQYSQRTTCYTKKSKYESLSYETLGCSCAEHSERQLETYNYIWSIMVGFHPSFTIDPSFSFSIHQKESPCLCAWSHTLHKGEHRAQTCNIIKSIIFNKWRKHMGKIQRYAIVPFNILLLICCCGNSKAAQRSFDQINIVVLLCIKTVCSIQVEQI